MKHMPIHRKKHTYSFSQVKDGVRLFEISDVVLRDDSCDTGARNCRRLVATYMGPTAGFEIIHGLVDRIMSLVQVRFYAKSKNGSKGSKGSQANKQTGSGMYQLRFVTKTNKKQVDVGGEGRGGWGCKAVVSNVMFRFGFSRKSGLGLFTTEIVTVKQLWKSEL